MKKINTSEQRILDCMQDDKARSSRDLSIACCMNEPAVRYHLRKLTRLGLIRKFPAPGISSKSGRKPDIYRLTPIDENNAVLCLTRSILNHINSSLGDTNSADTLALWLLSSQEDIISGKKLSVYETVKWLNLYHYAASWIAGKSGPEILVTNCPYCDLQPGMELLCRMDTALLNQLTGLSWKRLYPFESASEGGICHFVIT
jgi:predicted ArsR family transcriptional regulator